MGGTRFYWQLVRLGGRSLMLHKLRSGLTVLGMVFGVASVVSILAVGEGASHEVQEQLRRLGPDRILVRSVRPLESGGDDRLDYGLTLRDLDAIREVVPGIRSAAPTYELVKKVLRGAVLEYPTLVGTTPEFLDIHRLEVAHGRFLASTDLQGSANVAVLGAKIARKLFGPEDPVGQEVIMGSGRYTVVGLLAPRGEAGATLNDPDDSVFIPFTTARLRLEHVIKITSGGGKSYEVVELHQIGLRAETMEHVPQLANMIRRLLERSHEKVDYELIVPFELLQRAERTKRVFSWVLGSIAGISLLVGGIGIMNIMLATVTERTREIGVRRAIGAKKWHVTLQFLVETVVLSTAGGVIGLMVGVVLPPIVTFFSDMETIVTPWSLGLSLVISVMVGIIFGMYPARRAATMDPIEALRYE